MSRTCNLEALHAVHIQARIDHPALITRFHGARPKLHQHVQQVTRSKNEHDWNRPSARWWILQALSGEDLANENVHGQTRTTHTYRG